MAQPNLPTSGALWNNPLCTNGFEFIEYAAPDLAALGALFESIEQDQIRRGVL
jgi:4-hydroxyphenylpyruvate dioxygenase